ncbi:hypothetical protein UlMin_002998 [Ulmus minor]
MSWIFKSLQSDDPEASTSPTSPRSPENSSAGVKDEFSVIRRTIGRQLRGVAAFLAPPPTAEGSPGSSSSELETGSPALVGIRNDLKEIGGSFKSGLTLLSSTTGISRFASNLLQFQDKDGAEEEEEEDDDDDRVPGVTDEVLQFVTEISMRPECWSDFPLQLDHECSMSDAQREHASTVEQMIPDFAALRLRLCSSMSEQEFWMIYFILLLPRLNGRDFELLSTPKVVEAREVLLQKLQNKKHVQLEIREEDHRPLEKEASPNANKELDDSDKANTERCFDDKAASDSGYSAYSQVKLETEDDDISFSDLEDDDSDLSRRLSENRRAQDVVTSPPDESNDWVQLSRGSEAQTAQKKKGQSKDSEGEESNEWLTVDESD